MDTARLLRDACTVVLFDWPCRDVPEAVVRAGHTVIVHGGPRPEDVSILGLRQGGVIPRPSGGAPGTQT